MLAVKTVEKDTLAYQIHSRPFTAALDMSHVHVKSVVDKFRVALNDVTSTVPPERDALCFYLMNHGVAEVSKRFGQNDLLPEDMVGILESYHSYGHALAERMFFYMLAICFRESRHLKNAESFLNDEEVDPAALKVIREIHNTGSGGAVEYLKDWKLANKDILIGELTDTMTYLFNNGLWSGGYGGTAWGEVCSVLNNFVHGKISAELLMDTAFTLAHNNGPIFNKGLFFSHYDSSALLKILDVQRAGMIPSLVNEGTFKHLYSEITDWRKSVSGVLGGFGEEHVDWYMVKKLGAVGTYHKEQSDQQATHGVPDHMSTNEEAPVATPVKTPQAAEAYPAKPAINLESTKAGFFHISEEAKVKIIPNSKFRANQHTQKLLQISGKKMKHPVTHKATFDKNGYKIEHKKSALTDMYLDGEDGS